MSLGHARGAYTHGTPGGLPGARSLGLDYLTDGTGFVILYTIFQALSYLVSARGSMYSMPVMNVVVPNAATDSLAMLFEHSISDAEQIAISAPGTLPETATIEVSFNFDANYQSNKKTLAAATAEATWVDSGATLPTAGAFEIINMAELMGVAWRIHLDGAAAAARTFIVVRRTPMNA